MRHSIIALATVTLASALSLQSGPVEANEATPAAGACRSALPAFDGNIRTRPRAVQNEGSAIAFVSCGVQRDFDDNINSALVYLMNISAVPVTVDCTMIIGMSSPTYYTFTANVAANSGPTSYGFEVPENGYAGNAIAWSCSLPPGAGVNRLHFNVTPPAA